MKIKVIGAPARLFSGFGISVWLHIGDERINLGVTKDIDYSPAFARQMAAAAALRWYNENQS